MTVQRRRGAQPLQTAEEDEDRDAVVDFLRKTLGLPPRPKPDEAGAEEGVRDDVGEGGASVEAGVAVAAPEATAGTPSAAPADASTTAADADTPGTAAADAGTPSTAAADASAPSAPAAAVDDAESTPAEAADAASAE